MGTGATGSRGRVLVVDDDPAIRRSLRRGLALNGFAVDLAECGRQALGLLRERPADLIVLDISMPGLSGIEVCQALRDGGDDVPVLMLSALDETQDRIAGLQAGGDDYLVKPFALQELVLRLEALLRRRPTRPTDAVRVGGLTLDPSTREATLDGTGLTLTRREFELLEALARNAGIVLSRDQLLERVWGYDFEVRTDAVDTFVSYLRRKTERGGGPRLIHTVRGVGFVLRDDRKDGRGEDHGDGRGDGIGDDGRGRDTGTAVPRRRDSAECRRTGRGERADGGGRTDFPQEYGR